MIGRRAGVERAKAQDLTQGSIVRGLIAFALPIFWGQLLQQLYNMTDAWVVGNFATNEAFAAVSLSGNVTFLIVGFFNGIAIGGGVVISRYFGARDSEGLENAVHANFLFGLIASVISTVAGLLLTPQLLRWMNTPADVMGDALTYFTIYFAGVSTVVMYNICMAIMRAVGDSMHPLYYLILSSAVNVVLDLVFVAGFKWGVMGAAVATVLAQGLSVALCIVRMCRAQDATRLHVSKLRLHPEIMQRVIQQGLPTGVQNCVVSIGNMVIQANINSIGSYAISGHGAHAKLEGLVFLPIMSISMALPTFVSQNLGAGNAERARRGSVIGVAAGCVLAELIGVVMMLLAPQGIGIFLDAPEAIRIGAIHTRTVALFFCALAFSHCASGVLRGCGKAFVPMIAMLVCWCGIRIVYVTLALIVRPEYSTIAWAYPITWTLSTILFVIYIKRIDWQQLATEAGVRR